MSNYLETTLYNSLQPGKLAESITNTTLETKPPEKHIPLTDDDIKLISKGILDLTETIQREISKLLKVRSNQKMRVNHSRMIDAHIDSMKTLSASLFNNL